MSAFLLATLLGLSPAPAACFSPPPVEAAPPATRPVFVGVPEVRQGDMAVHAAAVRGKVDSTLVRLYEAGVPFEIFLASVSEGARPDTWDANWRRGVTDGELLERARRLPGEWRILAVALDACSDSVHTLPYIAALADALPDVELRIVGPEEGRVVMERHLTPDERGATPTFVVLDAAGDEAGCWVERPNPLQAFMLSEDHGHRGMERFRMKMAWYEADAGWTTAAEFVEVLEGAAAGAPVCRRPVDPDAPYPGAGPDGRPVGGERERP